MRNYITIKIILSMLVLSSVMFITSFIAIFIPYLLQMGLNSVFILDLDNAIWISAFIFAAALFRYIFSICQKYLANVIAWNITNRLRSDILIKIKGGDLIEQQSYTSGSLYEFIERDVKEIYDFISLTFVSIVSQLFTIIGILILLYQRNNTIFAIFLFYLLITAMILSVIAKYGDQGVILEEREKSTSVFSRYSELLHGKKDIMVLGELTFLLHTLDDVTTSWRPKIVKVQKYLYRFWSITVVVSALFSAISLIIGGIGYVKGVITIGEVYLYYLYSGLLSEPLKNIQAYLQKIKKYSVACNRLKTILNKTSTVRSGNQNVPLIVTLDIKNLSYSYGEGKQALSNFTLHVDKHDCIGIYGPSGCGKTTLSKLLCRELDYEIGDIVLNDIPIHRFHINSIRENFAYIKANDTIFNASLYDNLTLFNPNITKEAVTERMHSLNLVCPFDLNKEIEAETISKGQTQYINLLRLLFQEKQIIIFDEAASEIDQNEVENFFKIINLLKHNKMIFIISHHKEHLKQCNKIISMESYVGGAYEG